MRGLTRPRRRDHEGSRNGHGPLLLLEREQEQAAARAPLRSRRLLQPVPLAGIVLMLIGLLVVYGYTAAATRRTPVLVAAHDLPAGATIRLTDLRSSRIAADGDVLATLVTVTEEQSVVGRRLAVPVAGGEPLPVSALASPSATPAAFTLVLAVGHALGGGVRPGDHVSVLATFSSPSGAATTQVLARNLVVLSVGQAPAIGDPNQSTIPVTVALPNARLASRLALANSTAKLDLLRDSTRSANETIPSAQTPAGSGP